MAKLYGGDEPYHIGKVRKPHKWLVPTAIVVAVLLLLLIVSFLFNNKAAAPEQQNQSIQTETNQTEQNEENPTPQYNAKELQSVVDSWVKSHGGTYSVVVSDPSSNKTLATTAKDTQYFTASIYKLYVAYIGYQKIDDGTYSANQTYLNGWTRGKCLDEMIRTSNSPCAEKMWVELGKENLNTQLKKYGLTNTSMTGLYTSAADTAIILTNIQNSKDLSKESRSKLLESMKNQIYRDGLPAGFTKMTVYDKVGFRGTVEYHDTALVKTDKGTVVVSVLTKNAGTKNIAGLGKALQEALQ